MIPPGSDRPIDGETPRFAPLVGDAAPAGDALPPIGDAAPGQAAAGPPRSLYVHIPFCVSICPYCDFVVVAGAAARGPRSRIPAFVAALRRELVRRADALDATWGPPGLEPDAAPPRRLPLDTLYLGGGTPSLLPADDLAGLIELVRARYGLAADAEVTVEANPGTDERGDAAALVAMGVTRLSYGAQALDAGLLRTLGRRHSPVDVAAAVTAARTAGIGSLNLDLLYDVPGQTAAGFAADLDAALELGPDHLSLYALGLDDPEAEGLTGPDGDHLPTSSGARRWRAAARPRQDQDRAAAMYEHAVERLAAAGFEGYEISNWARPGHESRHNLAYWERRPYEAVGPGAHAFDGRTRRWNAARLDRYIEALSGDGAGAEGLSGGGAGGLPPGGQEILSPAVEAAERVILGLRLSRGVPASLGEVPPLAPHLAWAKGAGLVADIGADRIALTTRGRLLSNELFARVS